MALFRYRGMRQNGGAPVNGEMEGPSRALVVQQLLNTGVSPLEVVEVEVKKSFEQWWQETFPQKVTLDDLILFSRQMFSLTKAGVPISRALLGLADSLRHKPVLANTLRDVQLQLEGGRAISDAMARHPQVFSVFYVNLIRVGDNTGQLDQAFFQIANYLSMEKDTRDRVASALRYPAIVVSAIAIAIGIINVFVIPAFAVVFSRAKVELPWATKLLLATSSFFVAYWPYMLGILVASIFGMRYYVKTEAGAYLWDRLQPRLPLVGSIIMRATLARFSRSFAIAFRAGLPLVQTLGVISQAVGNRWVGEKVLGMRSGIERGDTLTRTAVASGIFTPLVLQMIAVGEETGGIDAMMEEVADFYEREVEYDLKTLSQAIEPILTVAVGILVLILALGVFMPMFGLGSAMMKKG